MENFELKAYRPTNAGEDFLSNFYVDTLVQKDTYFQTTDGRLKLREERSKNPKKYFIRYDRENRAKERICVYDFYPVEDVDAFKKVFGGTLVADTIVRKNRKLYLYKNARIHIDHVEGIDDPFIEIEVVIQSESDKNSSAELMDELLKTLNIKPEDKLDVGYRELIDNLNKIQ